MVLARVVADGDSAEEGGRRRGLLVRRGRVGRHRRARCPPPRLRNVLRCARTGRARTGRVAVAVGGQHAGGNVHDPAGLAVLDGIPSRVEHDRLQAGAVKAEEVLARGVVEGEAEARMVTVPEVGKDARDRARVQHGGVVAGEPLREQERRAAQVDGRDRVGAGGCEHGVHALAALGRRVLLQDPALLQPLQQQIAHGLRVEQRTLGCVVDHALRVHAQLVGARDHVHDLLGESLDLSPLRDVARHDDDLRRVQRARLEARFVLEPDVPAVPVHERVLDGDAVAHLTGLDGSREALDTIYDRWWKEECELRNWPEQRGRVMPEDGEEAGRAVGVNWFPVGDADAAHEIEGEIEGSLLR
mmetsp:Transcript_9209/g.29185  ORF Transcript_9209/g.29185 Transcript_9209/m.29185 type:complete len:358 (-) Transcript_9209:106-1179(-)